MPRIRSLLAAQQAGELKAGLQSIGRRHRLRRRRHRPRHRHRPRGRQRHHRHGPPARDGRHVRTTMFLGIAFTEALALFGFVLFFLAEELGRTIVVHRSARGSLAGRAKSEDVKAKNPILPEAQRDRLGRSSAFAIVFALLAWKAWPADQEGAQGPRGPHPRRPRAGRGGEARGRDVLEDYRRQLAEARTEAAGSSKRPVQAAEQVRQELIAAGRGRRGRACGPGRRRTSGSRPSGRWPTCRPGRRPVDRAGREGRRAQPRPRHADRAHRELHQPGREQR